MGWTLFHRGSRAQSLWFVTASTAALMACPVAAQQTVEPPPVAVPEGQPDLQDRDKPTFGFMSNDVSSERRVEVAVGRVATMLRETKRAGGKIAFVAGPVVVHTGGTEYFCELIKGGYVDVILSGNALAVHDIEVALVGTSLGIECDTQVDPSQATSRACASSRRCARCAPSSSSGTSSRVSATG